MGKQEDDLPGLRHEMMSGRGWFNRAAHSAHARSLFSYPAPFSKAHSPVRPRIIFLHRRHSSPGFSCPIGVIRHRPMPLSPPSVPLVRLVRAWSGAGRSHPYRVVRSSWASKQAGGRGHVVHVIRIVLVLISWRALRYGGASSSVPCGKQAGNGAMSSMSSMSSGFSSRGGRGGHCDTAGRHHPCRGVSKQASWAGAVSSSLRLAWASRGGVSSHPARAARASVSMAGRIPSSFAR